MLTTDRDAVQLGIWRTWTDRVRSRPHGRANEMRVSISIYSKADQISQIILT